MTCEAVIGVYMHTVLRMRQYAKLYVQAQMKLTVAFNGGSAEPLQRSGFREKTHIF